MKLSPPGTAATARTFWIALGLCVALLLTIEHLEHARRSGTENYAIGAGALIPYALALLIGLAALLFAIVRWRPLRLTLAAIACAAAAFLLLALTWYL